VLTTMRNHRGFTLVELLVVLLIMGVVTGGIFKLLNTTQRLSRAQAERVDLQSNVRVASIVIPGELREINAVIGGTVAQNDILAMPGAGTSIQYRAMRGIGYVCTGSTTTQLRLRDWNGLRAPDATRDSVYVFSDGAKTEIGTDDSWLPRRITSTASGNTCGGTAVLTLNIDALPAVPSVGTPVRWYEVMELSLYQNGGKSWLGMRSVSKTTDVVQPVLGPLKDNDGLGFVYLNSTGGTATTAANVRSIVLTIRGVTSQQVSSSGGNTYNTYVQDSLVSQVSLRNALR
jgi:prepilin-type N-terminal cleavage/methylation domain-containing protein